MRRLEVMCVLDIMAIFIEFIFMQEDYDLLVSAYQIVGIPTDYSKGLSGHFDFSSGNCVIWLLLLLALWLRSK